MDEVTKNLLTCANDLTASAMAVKMATETIVHEAVETADYIRYVVELVKEGKLEEALYHLRSEGTKDLPETNSPT